MRPQERDDSAFYVRQQVKSKHYRQRQPQHGVKPQRRLVAVALEHQDQRHDDVADREEW